MTTPADLAERMKRQILADMMAGLIPPTITSFSDLHDIVDANCYGGTEDLLGDIEQQMPNTHQGHAAAMAALCDMMNQAIEIVDAWIKAGGLHSGRCTCPRAVLLGQGCRCGGN